MKKHFLFAQERGDEASKCPDASWLKGFGERQINQVGFKAVTVELKAKKVPFCDLVFLSSYGTFCSDVQTDFRTHQKLVFFLVLPSNVSSSGLLGLIASMVKRSIFATVVGPSCSLYPS